MVLQDIASSVWSDASRRVEQKARKHEGGRGDVPDKSSWEPLAEGAQTGLGAELQCAREDYCGP